MKISSFIRDNMEAILEDWEDFAKSIQPEPENMSILALRDGAKGMMKEIADEVEICQSTHEQAEKSKGRNLKPTTITATRHGLERLEAGFGIIEMISEYRALRASVMRLRDEIVPQKKIDRLDLIRFNEAIDQRVHEAVVGFTMEAEMQTRQFDTVLSSSPDHNYILDLEGKFLYVNDALLKTLHISRDELLGKSYFDLNFSEAPDLHKTVKKLIQTATRNYGEVKYCLPSGEVRCFEYVYTPVLNDDKSVNTVACSERDITDRKQQASTKYEKLQVQFNQAQKMESVGRLAGGVAHDFNNMLGVILGHTEMALEEIDPSAPLYANLQAVQQAAERSATLTRQLLAFARKQTIAPKVVDINDTVEGMLKMLRRLIGEDIHLLWQPGRNLQSVKIDPAQIDQLLANLCVNARDAVAGVGKITIETDAKTFDEDYCADHLGFLPGEYILLEVSDDGCGMDKETMNQIFEPFFTTKEQGKGTGLGLASIYGVVKQNNGFINVYSEPDQGTTFKIYLPVYAAKSAGVVEKASDLPTEHGNETILLVEDESAILKMTTSMLTRLGYTVVAAATPGEAIRLAHEYQGRIDLLMTDVVMPEMNGRELAGNLLSHYPDLKRLFMSGYTANVIVHHGVLDEGVHFIQKPFSMKDLGGKLREALEG